MGKEAAELHNHNTNKVVVQEQELGVTSLEKGESNLEKAKKKVINWAVVISILIGDGAHNFVDGIVIGAAFKVRDSGVACVVASVIAGLLYPLSLTTVCVCRIVMQLWRGLLVRVASDMNSPRNLATSSCSLLREVKSKSKSYDNRTEREK